MTRYLTIIHNILWQRAVVKTQPAFDCILDHDVRVRSTLSISPVTRFFDLILNKSESIVSKFLIFHQIGLASIFPILWLNVKHRSSPMYNSGFKLCYMYPCSSGKAEDVRRPRNLVSFPRQVLSVLVPPLGSPNTPFSCIRTPPIAQTCQGGGSDAITDDLCTEEGRLRWKIPDDFRLLLFHWVVRKVRANLKIEIFSHQSHWFPNHGLKTNAKLSIKKDGYGNDKLQEKNISCPPMSPDKQTMGNDYAFDNPYFKDDEVDHVKQEDPEKGETGFHLDNGDITPAQNAKASNGTTGQPKKNRPFSSLPFHAVFHPSGKKQRAIDDTYISKHLERITVPLRGHDFTGLGFNICGNMRDGIFVKDVLHRGPASESGKIKAGDRIVGVTVSFGAMVYEDALTILSYASPYDVRLEIEKSPSQPLPPSPKRVGTSTSFRNSSQGRLFHPLYRSQSIMDLSQIGKDGMLSENSPAANAKHQKEATPKRSQSVEASNGGPKARPVVSLKSNDESKSLSSNKGSRKSSTSSCDSSSKVATITTTVPLPEKTQQVAPTIEEVPCTKKEVKSSRFRVEQINVKAEAPSKQVPPAKPARETVEVKQSTSDNDVQAPEKTPDPQPPKAENGEKPIQADEEPPQEPEKPTAPPRKAGTPAKRKAPAPPPVNLTKTETSAVVHRADEQPQEPVVTEPPEPASNPEPPPPPTSQVPDLVSSDASSLASRPDEEVEPSSPGRRKASSLGDLTHLEQGSNRKSSTSSAILERAVSMDLQQSMPGENLIKQKKILKAPTFEDDYDENREGDQNDTEGGRLKRWDDGLDKVLGGLTNGHGDHHVSDPHIEEVTSPKIEEHEINESKESEVDVPAPTKKLLKVDIDLDLSGSETSQNEDNQEDSNQQLTSTPVKKIIEVKNSVKDDDISLDEVPFLASSNVETTEEESSASTTTTKHTIRTNSTPLFAPVTISIPIIKPDLKHFENLPSPPTASTHPALDPAWRVSSKVSSSDDNSKSQLERISVQSLYRPIFTNKESQDNDESVPEKLVNGIDSDSSEHYSTAQEAESSADTSSTLSVTLTSPTVANNVAVKAPNSAAGFAKTLIIPGPSEVESLLSLAAEPNTPPPQLDPPPKTIENE
ncbi:PDZ domain-containing protein [Nephila pilipes]|uniref:PDZ domain-containing protein n=1 Tax=Nephila pilipes TaxID=299642 RepID=A0A8X6U137_NEPPI|nr:PDZ domain-containing protein [Nephila pilipes]